MILNIYAILSVIMLILYHRTKYAKRIPDKWKGKSTIRLTLFHVLRSILFMVLWPGLVAHYLNERRIRAKYRSWKKPKHMTLSLCNGSGILECMHVDIKRK